MIASVFLVLCGLFSSIGTTEYQSNITTTVESVVVEGMPVFIPSATGPNYVDSVQSLTYGTHTNAPPSGMGENSDVETILTEEDITGTNLMTQTNFPSPDPPDGWSDSAMSYNGDFASTGVDLSGYIYCSDVDTSSYASVEFIVRLRVIRLFGSISARVYFYDSSGNWDLMATYGESGWADRTVTSSASEYRHSQFKVQVSYTASDTENGLVAGDSWRINGLAASDISAFQAVYAFTGVDYNSYDIERLVVEFDSSSSTEYLDFYFEAGDTTPDYLIANNVNSDFNIDIGARVTGSTCYLMIRDDYRSGDSTLSTWRIDRMYINLINSFPSNDATPSCSNLDDTDNLYGRNKYYEISTAHSDDDGFAHIDYLTLQCWTDTRSQMYWEVRYDEDTNTFSESSDSNNYITLDTGGSSSSRSGIDLDLIFDIMINWNHPDTNNIDLRCYIIDAESDATVNFYEVNWDIETRLEFDSFGLSDDRGDIDNSITASGTVNYYGGTIHPPVSQVDVYVSCDNVTSSPWQPLNYEATGGTFSSTVYADDEVGIDFYTFLVVDEGDGAGGTSLLDTAYTDTYISDRIIVESLYSDADTRINVDDTISIYADLEYEYDGASVTTGTVTIEGATASHEGGGIWSMSHSESIVTSTLFDEVTHSGGSYGVTEVDQNSQSTTVVWDQVTVRGFTSDYLRVDVDTQVTVNATLEYEYDDSDVTDGTVTIDGFPATHLGSGVWSIAVTESSVTLIVFDQVNCSGNEHGINSVNPDSQSVTVIWDRIIVLSMYSSDAENRTDLYHGVNVYCTLRYEFDNSYVDTGTVMINQWIAPGGTNGLYILSISSFLGSITFNNVTFSDGPYNVSVVNQNDEEVTVIWDGIEIFDVAYNEWPVIDEVFEIAFSARLAYDGHPLDGSDEVVFDDEVATWNGTHFVITRSYPTLGDRVFYANSSSESTYSITTLAYNSGHSVHVTNTPSIMDVDSGFTPSGSAYVGILSSSPLWIQWDPENDPSPPSFNFTVSGAYFSSWSVTSSWSSTVVASGGITGDIVIQIESELDYTLGNHSYTILAMNHGGYSATVEVYITVRDFTTPGVVGYDDFLVELGSTGNNITWSLSDANPDLYSITGNGTGDVLMVPWTNGDVTISVGVLEVGVYSFTIIVLDDYSNEASDTVIVTVEDTTPPEVSHPDDVIFTFGEVGHELDWTCMDLRPDSYEIRRDGTLIDSGDWSAVEEIIEISLDGLGVGLWVYEIRLYDAGNLTVSDEVQVAVIAETATTTQTTTTTTQTTSSTQTTFSTTQTSTTTTETTTTVTTTTEPTTPTDQPDTMVLIVILGIGSAVIVIIIVIVIKKRG